MAERPDSLRVAFLAGGLTRGGAEKQLLYMVRALREAGVSVRVYTLGRGEFYEASFRASGVSPMGVGSGRLPPLRLANFAWALRDFRPDIVQAAHAYVNLYVALVSRLYRALAVGAIRSDGVQELQDLGGWGPLLLRMPAALLVNSETARDNVVGLLGMEASRLHVLPNVIDLAAFETQDLEHRSQSAASGEVVVVAVARHVRSKRLDRFLEALALARRSAPGLKGLLVGAGPERPSLEVLASRLGLGPDGLEFHGPCDDVPGVLAKVDMLALTSDHEGFPNVILEAMAARLPVVCTPAGDAAAVVQNGLTGFVVPFNAVEQLAERLVRLALAPGLRHQLGEAGYARVKARYACGGLAERLLMLYAAMAQRAARGDVLRKLPVQSGGEKGSQRHIVATYR